MAGFLGVLAGGIWNVWFPINKNLWTSSFVLWSAGLALIFLTLLYWAVEIRGWRGAWTVALLVFGMNPIAGFVADAIGHLNDELPGGAVDVRPKSAQQLGR